MNDDRAESLGREAASVPDVAGAAPEAMGDTTIFSVVEEVVVVERRLVLKEEVRIRRVQATEHHREMVTLREQEATVTRTALEAGAPAVASAFDALPSNPSHKGPIQ